MGHRPDHLVTSRGRRRFLMAGGAALALPFLESLARPKPSFAWTPQTGMPRRLVTFFHGHGLIMEAFVPGPSMSLGPILQPIADVGLVEKSLVITGLNMKTEGGHPGTASLFTCTPLIADEYGITHGTTPSVEHIIGRHMQDGGLARRLDLAINTNSTNPDANALI
jgi:hypothetical protein